MKSHVHTFAALILAAFVLAVTPAAAEVTFWPDSLDFGNIPVGGTVTRSFWIKNTGADSLIEQLLYSHIDFANYIYSPNNVRLAPGDSIEVSLGINPSVPGSVVTRVFFGFSIDGVEYASVDFWGPIFAYRAIPAGLEFKPSWSIKRCLHEQRYKIVGSGVAALQNAQLRVEPDSGLVVRKEYMDEDSIVLGILAPLEMPEGFYELRFTDGSNTLDSLYCQVITSFPILFSIPADTLIFSPGKQQDTLFVRGWNLFSDLIYVFPSSNLRIVSTDFFPDTTARLVVQAQPGIISGFVMFAIERPDSLISMFGRTIFVNADALPLAPESGAPGAALPRAFSLGANVPNPFNPSTSITYSVGGEAPVTVHQSVFNQRGQVVAVLVDRVVAPGQYTVNWDGRGRGGEQLPSGVYFYRLTAGDFSLTRKMVLLK
ncbi:T9SS type A sorting domain-containing protein [bacterium]|nr:T9SS type A sorting domain-containing protein [bacterium]